MHHLLAYFESTAASQTDSDIAAVLGQTDFVSNAHQVLPDDRWLVMGHASGLGLVQARIDVPDLRQVALLQMRPIQKALLPFTDPNVADWRRRPLRIRKDQEIRMLQTTDGTAGPNNNYAGLWFHDGNFSVGEGPEYVIRATGTTTLVAGAWTQVALTYQDQLPPGKYDIVGMEVMSATGVYSRVILPGANMWRPGILCMQNESQRNYWPFYGPSTGLGDVGLGSFGQFSNIYLPTVEILANAADTAEIVYFRCRKIA